MRVGIMQPYFFPYLGHFALIAHVEKWVIFDVTQYTPKRWMNRNRILHPAGGSQYITIALSNSSMHIKTCQALILDKEASKKHVLGKLSHYKRFAPYYEEVINIVDATFSRATSEYLVDLNFCGLKVVCEYLGIKFDAIICSKMDLNIPEGLGPGDWAPEICSLIGASEYVNPIGGKDLFSRRDFSKKGIDLKFMSYSGFEYVTIPYGFEPDMSILDVMMWNNPDDIKKIIFSSVTLING